MKKQIQDYINHVALVLDASGSMEQLSTSLVKIFDDQIKYLCQRSRELNQETRVSVYTFADATECLIFDMDVLRVPSIRDFYHPGGQTALIDAMLKSIDDLQKTPQLYISHAFLVYLLTDGQENRSAHSPSSLSTVIKSLPANWTIAAFVPDQNGVFETKKCGLSADNISVWDSTSSRGLEEAGKTIRISTDNFMRGRAAGIVGTKNLFKMADNINASSVKTVLSELPVEDYQLFPVHTDAIIKPFVEAWTQTDYRVGSAYYQLVKPETIQPHKQVCIKHKLNSKVYVGSNARSILALPDYEVKVSPANFTDFDIFVQSTSTNRKIPKNTQVLVIR